MTRKLSITLVCAFAIITSDISFNLVVIISMLCIFIFFNRSRAFF